MLSFFGVSLPGFHEKINEELPELHEARTHFAGVWGDSVIPLGAGARQLTVKLWLNDPSFTSADAVQNFLGALDLLVQVTDVLTVTGAAPAVYDDTEFVGWKRTGDVLPVVGQGMPAGTYWCEIELYFRQNTI